MRTFHHRNVWVIILAGGEGRRLHALTTTNDGVAIAKQYCSLQNGPSLLQQTLQRASSIVDREHIYAIVAAAHRTWWAETLALLPTENVIAEPKKCGTANGVLLSILHVAARDPHACVVLMPADHHVQDEALLTRSLERAIRHVKNHAHEILLLGMESKIPDPEYGYVVPGRLQFDDAFNVARFEEKPTQQHAVELIANGALINTFIVIAQVQPLIALYEDTYPKILSNMRSAVSRALIEKGDRAIEDAYRHLPTLDFCKDLLEARQHSQLRVMPVPACGWTDLGTVQRVSETLQQLPHTEMTSAQPSHAQLNLAEQYAAYQAAQQPTRLNPPRMTRDSNRSRATHS